MSIKIPADFRTALRKMLRDHPNVLDYMKSKSEVNDLTRDELIKLADNLEVDFLSTLFNNKDIELGTIMEFKRSISNSSTAKGFRGAFSGEILSDFILSAFGESQTLKLKCNYEYTPEWQFACLDDKRLKHRGGSSNMSLNVEVMGELSYSLEKKAYIREESEWLAPEECSGIWNLIRGPICEQMDRQIERRAIDEDKVNRQKMGFLPSDKY